MTPPVAAPVAERIWVLGGVGHRLHGGMSVGCWEPITAAGHYLDPAEADRHEVKPCYRAECFPNGFGINQYRAAA